MENKYLVKVCALLKAPVHKKQEKVKPYSLKPKTNKYTAKITKQKHK